MVPRRPRGKACFFFWNPIWGQFQQLSANSQAISKSTPLYYVVSVCVYVCVLCVCEGKTVVALRSSVQVVKSGKN